ncbi:MAG: hypothetical protein D6693_03570 [Planctomycetota bacterium]|nr:MAG: hypothetical protein D6693_03570 [Planctomycetota bacterium]
MSIFPLEQFEKDLRLAQEERELYERLKVPKTVVVRFGVMGMIGEYPYSGKVTPGCGSKLVLRTHRGLEIGELLTSTCPNAGCGKSVTRQEMLEYIERSGGRDYPFFTEGRALRVASAEDMNRQRAVEATRPALVASARAAVARFGLPMKIIEADPILGGERLTLYFTAEHRVDFRALARALAEEHACRIELRQVGARDEARLTADYERCGQHCCCKQFLKVLKPVSMRSAKVQKATLDPLKISGRCGRLMCCLRYEDETYETLRKRLPRRKSRVGTPEGPGIVVDTQILTQLALVELDADRRRIAVPIEELGDPDAPPVRREPDPMRGAAPPDGRHETDVGPAKKKRRRSKKKRRRSEGPPAPGADATPRPTAPTGGGSAPSGQKKKRRRGRRGRRRRGGDPGRGGGPPAGPSGGSG